MIDILQSLKESPQYAMVCEETLARVCQTLIPRYSKQKEAVKAVKAHLRAICGAFLSHNDIGKAGALLDGLVASASDGDKGEDEKRVATELMRLHTSTAERLPFLREFYSGLFDFFGKPRSVADIGCGFNPFAAAFMELGDGFTYRAADINLQSLGLVSRYFEFIKSSRSADAVCEPCDILTRLPDWEPCDIAFVFKLLPLMEQQKRGSAATLLAGLKADVLVVTFPTVTLGGRRKGMSAFYTEYFEKLIKDDYVILYRKEYATELVFGVRRKIESMAVSGVLGEKIDHVR